MLKFALAAAATAVTLDGLKSEDALVDEQLQELDLADQLLQEDDTYYGNEREIPSKISQFHM